MTRDDLRKHDHSSTGNGGDSLSPKRVDAKDDLTVETANGKKSLKDVTDELFKQSSPPAETDALWLDTNSSPPTLKEYNDNSSQWVTASPNTTKTNDTTGNINNFAYSVNNGDTLTVNAPIYCQKVRILSNGGATAKATDEDGNVYGPVDGSDKTFDVNGILVSFDLDADGTSQEAKIGFLVKPRSHTHSI